MTRNTGLLIGLLLFYVAFQLPYCFSDVAFNSSEGVYWQTLRQMAAGRVLYSEIFYSQFPLFIETARLGRFLPVLDLYAGRMILLLFAPLALVGIFQVGRRWHSRQVGLTAAVLLAADPLFFQLSHQLTGEVAGLALALWAAVIVSHGLTMERGRNKALLVAALLLAAAIQIKPLMALPAFGLAVFCWLRLPQASAEKVKILLWPVGFCLALNLMVLWHYGWFATGGFKQLQGGAVQGAAGLVDRLSYNIKNVLTAGDYSRVFLYVHVPILLLVVILLWTERPRFTRYLALAAAATTLILIFSFRLNTDHLLLFSVPYALALAVALQESRTSVQKLIHVAVVYALMMGLLFNSKEFRWPNPKPRGSFVRAKQLLEMHTPMDASVIGNSPFLISAANRLTPPEYTDFSAARVASRSIDCAGLEERFARGDIYAFVLADKGLEALDCGRAGLEALVQKYFPHRLADHERLSIFLIQPAP